MVGDFSAIYIKLPVYLWVWVCVCICICTRVCTVGAGEAGGSPHDDAVL